MTGKQHLTAGAALGAVTIAIYEQIVTNWSNERVVNAFTEFTQDVRMFGVLTYPLAACLFFIGCLLPDCDSRTSTLGRWFHIPVEHRTWTHTIWFLLIFAVLSWHFPILWSLTFGVFLHLFCDAFSRAGVCWFYPFSRYKKWGHAKVKNWHFLYLYSTEAGGWIVCGVLITLSAFYVLGVIGWIPPITNIITTIDRTIEAFVSLYIH